MTQQQTILLHLEIYGSISFKQAYGYYSIQRLSAHIFFLRKMGYNIQSIWLRSIDGKRFKKYIYVK